LQPERSWNFSVIFLPPFPSSILVDPDRSRVRRAYPHGKLSFPNRRWGISSISLPSRPSESGEISRCSFPPPSASFSLSTQFVEKRYLLIRPCGLTLNALRARRLSYPHGVSPPPFFCRGMAMAPLGARFPLSPLSEFSPLQMSNDAVSALKLAHADSVSPEWICLPFLLSTSKGTPKALNTFFFRKDCPPGRPFAPDTPLLHDASSGIPIPMRSF